MSELHKRQIDTDIKGLESKKGERRRLCSYNVGNRSPFLEYKFIPSPESLDKAFDILFDEVFKDNNL